MSFVLSSGRMMEMLNMGTVNSAPLVEGKTCASVGLVPFYLFMYLGRVCLGMQQKIIQAVLFGSVFQINVNDSL